MKQLVKISVVIPTSGRTQLLTKCIDSISKQTIKPFELIVVDNSQNEKIKQLVVDLKKNIPFLIYVKEPKKGVSYARNRGIKKSGCPIIAFIDDDCVADKAWLWEAYKSMGTKNVSVVVGYNRNGLPNNIFSCLEHLETESFFSKFQYSIGKNHFQRVIDTKNFAIKKSLINRYKIKFSSLFSPYSIFEDVDFSFQLSATKTRIVVNDKMQAHHIGRSTLVSHLKREFNKGIALHVLHNKWKSHYSNGIGQKLQEDTKSDRYEPNFSNKNYLFKICFYLLRLLDYIVSHAGYFFAKN